MTQKEFASNPYSSEFKAELEKVWARRDGTPDIKMVDYCIKTADELIKLSNGMLYATETPRIETSFCFGYSTDYSGHECSDAENARRAFLKNSENFKRENLSSINREINDLHNSGRSNLFVRIKYCSGGNIGAYEVVDTYNRVPGKDWERMADCDRTAIIEALKRTRGKFEKRLDTYLKKYGTSKLRTWTYWRDE